MGLEFENIVVMFQISVLEFDLLQSLVQKYESLNLGLILVVLGWNFKNCCQI